MKIMFTEDRRLSSDSHQFTLDKRRVVKGVDIWTPYAYYGSLRQALRCIPQQLLKESDAEGVMEILRVLRRTEKRLLEAMGE